jgi:hypothetical protein
LENNEDSIELQSNFKRAHANRSLLKEKKMINILINDRNQIRKAYLQKRPCQFQLTIIDKINCKLHLYALNNN